jgi:hypothetical protein
VFAFVGRASYVGPIGTVVFEVEYFAIEESVPVVPFDDVEEEFSFA